MPIPAALSQSLTLLGLYQATSALFRCSQRLLPLQTLCVSFPTAGWMVAAERKSSICLPPVLPPHSMVPAT
ncbi:hypothetical protein EDD16DRAFT_1598240 [Pisolithus croceorrhizus]|nr:hypothetical protein EDD16DRAFT_1598240 [Pisolithus croceorrhizus]